MGSNEIMDNMMKNLKPAIFLHEYIEHTSADPFWGGMQVFKNIPRSLNIQPICKHLEYALRETIQTVKMDVANTLLDE